jgi:hypothetical protein
MRELSVFCLWMCLPSGGMHEAAHVHRGKPRAEDAVNITGTAGT